ncbi:MAG: porin family protein [Bacteroidota bacterium]
MIRYLFLTVLLCFSTFMLAQKNESYWGFKIGLNNSDVQSRVNPEFDLGSKTGFFVEAFRNFSLDNNYSFQAGYGISQKGGRQWPEQLNELNEIELYTANFTYVILPLSIQRKIGPFYAELGLEPSFRIINNAIIEDPSYTEEAVEDFWDSRFDFGIIAGIGYHIENIELSFRLVPGLLNISNDVIITNDIGANIARGPSGRNRIFQVGLAYRVYN